MCCFHALPAIASTCDHYCAHVLFHCDRIQRKCERYLKLSFITTGSLAVFSWCRQVSLVIMLNKRYELTPIRIYDFAKSISVVSDFESRHLIHNRLAWFSVSSQRYSDGYHGIGWREFVYIYLCFYVPTENKIAASLGFMANEAGIILVRFSSQDWLALPITSCAFWSTYLIYDLMVLDGRLRGVIINMGYQWHLVIGNQKALLSWSAICNYFRESLNTWIRAIPYDCPAANWKDLA